MNVTSKSLPAAALLFFLLSSPVPGTPLELEATNTYAVITGVLRWSTRELSGYPKKDRRDLALYRTLRAKGVPQENMTLLLDQDATEDRMRKAIEEVALRAGNGSTFIFYYAGHGYTGTEGIYFASHDVGTETGPAEGFPINAISTTLARHFKGARVLLMADCCYSGGLGDEARKLSESGIPAVGLTSASVANSSAGRWTFTCTVIDVLSGRALYDHDGDGYISLLEAAAEVRDAMNYVENQHHGFALYGLEETFRLAPVRPADSSTGAIPEPYELRQYVTYRMKTRKRQRSMPARIVGADQGRLQLEIQGYASRRLAWTTPTKISECRRPHLPAVTASLVSPPAQLSPEMAEEKAMADGKYSTLLTRVPARFDYLAYGAFKDWGYSRETEYQGHVDLPHGYWVYVYPHWYVFRDRAEQSRTGRPRG